MKHYLFCLRHFNDIDNIAPAIYFLLERRQVRVTVLIYSLDYPYRDDPSLNFLGQSFPDRFRVRWVGEFDGYSYSLVTLKGYQGIYRRLMGLRGRQLVDRAVSGQSENAILVAGLRNVVCDWGDPKTAIFDQNRTPKICGLLSAIRACGVAEIISLPVSPWPNYNVLRQVDFVKLDAENFRKKHDYHGFDRMGQVDRYYSDSIGRLFRILDSGNPLEGKTSALGTVRFTSEWLEIRSRYASTSGPLGKTGKSKLLVLPSHEKNNSFWAEYVRTLQFISQFRQFEIIVKPHTRYGHRARDIPSEIVVLPDADSSHLIDWSDVVLYWATSVAFEGFQKKKLMVCLDYINANRSVFSLYDAGVVCRCRDDLVPVLHRYPDLDDEVVVNDAGTRALIEDIINGGKGGDPITNYIEFIEGNALGKSSR